MLIRLARQLHASGKDDEGYNYVLDVFEKHLTTLSVRFYRGDIAAVDEFLQLYNLDQTREDTPNAEVNQNAMNRKYLVAIKVNADNGSIVEGNANFDTDEPLTARHLEIVKERYCSNVTAKGVKCSPEKAVVYAVIPLDA